MRISDWSSDVCSSDLDGDRDRQVGCRFVRVQRGEQAGTAAAENQDVGFRPLNTHSGQGFLLYSSDIVRRLAASSTYLGAGVSTNVQQEQRDRKSTRLNSSH